MRVLALAAGVQLFLSGCPTDSKLPPPAPKSVEPSSIKVGQRQRVRILGESFYVAGRRWIGGTTSVDTAFSARLGGIALEDLERLNSRELAATVPETLPVGTWELEVTGPSGAGVLRAALTVWPPEICNNRKDDDGDGDADCRDSDCLDQPCDDRDGCTVNDTCTAARTCVGAPCVAPSPCHSASCATGTCVIAVAAGASCDDGLSCTSSDVCRADATCSGANNCLTPPTACHQSTGSCEADGGCSYQVAVGKPCDDGVACTWSDVCEASGACVGVGYSCQPPGECFTSACDGAGGCSVSTTYAAPCGDGGVCLGDGGCLPVVWPYQPSNFQPAAGTPGPDLTIPAGCIATFSSTTNSWQGSCLSNRPTGTIVAMPGGGQAMLINLWNFTVESGALLNLGGDKPIIFAAFGDVRIAGQIRAESNSSGSSGNMGPGANSPSCGLMAGGDATSSSSGGGGGGLGGVGASGGGSGAGAGGSATMATPEPLRGGCRGGAGIGTSAGTGGSGGGAVQISAGGVLEVSSLITTSGAGGKQATGGSAAGGGGGGSGGMILLEGNTVTLTSTAVLTSNGGGGGSGSGNQGSGKAGDDGSTSTAVPALGGSSGPGAGGSGGAGTMAATPGQLGSPGGSGGGGGGVGLIIIRAASCIRQAAVISPAPIYINCP